MSNCPCCSRQMLRHVGRSGVYWYCNHCRLSLPELSFPITTSRLPISNYQSK